MIKEISLTNFKLFKNRTTFKLSKFNLLTGINGRGKSSFLQNLLLLKQSSDRSEYGSKVTLNDDCVQLGTFDDIKNSEASRSEEIRFEYCVELGREFVSRITLHIKETEDDLAAEIRKVEYHADQGAIKVEGRNEFYKYYSAEINRGIPNRTGQGPNLFQMDTLIEEYRNSVQGETRNFTLPNADKNVFRRLLPSNNRVNFVRHGTSNIAPEHILNFSGIHYVSAERMGPQNYVAKQSLDDFVHVGTRGEMTLNVISSLGNDLKIKSQLCFGNEASTLETQTVEWLSYIFDGGRLELRGKERESSVLSLLLNSENSDRRYKPTNVGFGYSYVLPIIVTGLIAKDHEIVIVENPEAHLHPRAQARLTEFLLKVSQSGPQVFVESHSEHVLNSARVQLSKRDNYWHPDDIKVLFFTRDVEELHIPITINFDGSTDAWPSGFFDQTDEDLKRIIGF